MPIRKVVYSKDAIQTISSEIQRAQSVETGGVLIGYQNEDSLYVEIASGPGPKAKKEGDYFKADPNYVDMIIDKEVAESKGKCFYLGEWHSHPQTEPLPSKKDLASISEIADTGWGFCLLLIVGAIDFKASDFSSQSITILKVAQYDQFFEVPPELASN